jgi:cellulose biosynthesis protein BcsQ
VWDLDPQGAASFYFRIKPKVKGGSKKILRGKKELDELIKGTDYEGLDLLPADFSYRNMDLVLDESKKPAMRLLKLLRPLSYEYDIVFLDCPPSISLVSENIFQAAYSLLIPTIPTTLSLRTYRQLLKFVADNNLDQLKLMPFFSMVDRRKRMHQEIIRDLPKVHPELLATHIPYASDVERMGMHRTPLAEYADKCPAAIAYEELWGEVKTELLM